MSYTPWQHPLPHGHARCPHLEDTLSIGSDSGMQRRAPRVVLGVSVGASVQQALGGVGAGVAGGEVQGGLAGAVRLGAQAGALQMRSPMMPAEASSPSSSSATSASRPPPQKEASISGVKPSAGMEGGIALAGARRSPGPCHPLGTGP